MTKEIEQLEELVHKRTYRTGEVTQLRRIADALEEVIRMVKKDQQETRERFEKRWDKEDEQTTRASNGPSLPAALALARGPRPKLQATSLKLQAPSFRLDKIKL